MLQYIEIMRDGGSISFDTYCPDGTVESAVHYSMINFRDEILRAIRDDKSTIIAVRVICGPEVVL